MFIPLGYSGAGKSLSDALPPTGNASLRQLDSYSTLSRSPNYSMLCPLIPQMATSHLFISAIINPSLAVELSSAHALVIVVVLNTSILSVECDTCFLLGVSRDGRGQMHNCLVSVIHALVRKRKMPFPNTTMKVSRPWERLGRDK